MKKLLYAVMGVFTLACLVWMSSAVQAAEGYAPLGDDPTPTPTPTPEYYLGNTYSAPVASYYDDIYWWYGHLCYTTTDNQKAILGRVDSDTGENSIASSEESLGPDCCEGESIGGGSNSRLDTTWVCWHDSGQEAACTYACDQVGGCSEVGNRPGISEGQPADKTLRFGVKHDDSSHNFSFYVKPVYYGDPDEGCEQPDPNLLPVFATNTLGGTDDEGDHYDLVSGRDYYITTANGPWNDGSNDRYDVALSFDGGTNWTQLGELYSEDYVEDACAADEGANYQSIKITADESRLTLDIRVNDEDGAFGDNTGTIDYTINHNPMGGGSCGMYYSAGEMLTSGSIASSDEDGDSMDVLFDNTNNAIYKLRILGPWSDNGTDKVSTEITNYLENDWTQTQYYPGTRCVETAEDIDGNPLARDIFFTSEDYMQLMSLRAHDGDGNFGNNTGDIDYEVYAADYVPPRSTCAQRFEKTTYIETPTIDAQASNGWVFPNVISGLTPGNWYVMEVPDYPGYWDAGAKRWDFEISTDRSSWSNASIFADCTNPLDQNRNEYYFQAEQTDYYFRAVDSDNNLDNNNGSATFNLYGAKDLKYTPPTGEDCSAYYSLTEVVYDSSVDATASQGVALPSLFTDDQYYAVELEPPTWDNDGDPWASGEIAYTNTEIPTQFYNFAEFPGSLCVECEDPWCTTYFQYQHGYYKLRAGPDTDWTDNSGELNYKIWTVNQEEETPNTSCELDYADVDMWSWVVEDMQVEATASGGVYVTDQMTADTTYKFETAAGPAFMGAIYPNPAYPTYKLEISIDGGQNWQLLRDYVDCLVMMPDGDHIRGFVTPESTTGEVRMRVYDTYPDMANFEYLEFDMWTSDHDDPSSPWEDPGPGEDDGWDPVAGCEGTCFRPGSWLSVSKWVKYAFCRFSEWLSWCPYHTRKIMNLKDAFYTVEPFRTVLETIDVIVMIRNEVNAYNWGTEGGGAGDGSVTVEQPEGFVFAPGEGGGAGLPMGVTGANSPWGEGDIVLRDTETPAYSTTCNNMLADALGVRLALPMCFIFNILDQLGLMSWFQWIWDIAMLVGFGFYINKKWVDKLQ